MRLFRLPFHLPTSRWKLGLAAGVFAAAVVCLAGSLGRTQSLERQALDGLFGMRGPRYPHPKIIIIVADTQSVARAGQWPLPRHVYAQIVRGLKRNGARVIAIDALFPTLSERPAEDAEFAKECEEAGNVVQSMAFHLTGGLNSPLPVTVPGEQGGFAERFELSGQRPCLNAVWASAALPALRHGAAALGHVTVFPESDGTLRRVPHLIRYRGKIYPSLGLAATATFLGLTPRDIKVTESGLSIANTQVPLDENGESLVNWIGGNNSFPTFSMNELLEGRVRRSAIEGSLVFVGVTAAGAYEQRATPFSPNQPAVELQANAADDILSRRALYKCSALYRGALLLACALLGGLAATRLGWGGALWFSTLCIGTWILAFLALRANLWVPYAAPLCAAALAWTATTLVSYRQQWEENWRADESMSALARGSALLSSGTDLQQLCRVICETARTTLRAQEVHLTFEGETPPQAPPKSSPALCVNLPRRESENANANATSPLSPNAPRGGVLNVWRHAGELPFQPREAALLETIAEQASLALANLEYYELLRGEIELADQNLVQANTLLADQSAKLTAAVEGIHTALIVTDDKGKTVFCNAAGTEILRDAVPPLGSDLALHLRAFKMSEIAELCEKSLGAARSGLFLTDEKLHCETTRHGIDNEASPSAAHTILSTQLTPLCGADGSFSGLMLAVADVTAQRALDSMKSEFVSFVAHELRSPLTSILGYASLLQTAGDKVDAAQRNTMTEAIMRQGTRLNRLISELLDISRIESGKSLDLRYAPLDLAALCRTALEAQKMALMGRSGYHLNFVGPQQLAIVGDADRLEQVLINLLSNAAKYSPQGGNITLELEEQNQNALVRVRDEGMGLSQSQVDSLFQKYYRTPDARRLGIKGTGLGLYLVAQLVEAHGGAIKVDSVQGQGTTFSVTLPQTKA